jgi:hypothetical protein
MTEEDRPPLLEPPAQEAAAPLRADPLAKARAVKAEKAAAKAAEELAKAEASIASAAQGQPVVSSFRGRAANPFFGDLVEVRVTPWGHAEISTGGEDGFERFAAGAICKIPEQSARSLFNKRWITPIDNSYEAKWLKQNKQELLAAMRAKANTTHRLEHGVGVGEEWRSALDGGELGFNPTERDLKEIGFG